MTEILRLRDTAAGESRLESLPPGLLVEILCRLSHRDLGAAACASHKLRAAVEMAYEAHFDFSARVPPLLVSGLSPDSRAGSKTRFHL